MANQIFVDPFPGGLSIESQVQVFRGNLALCGAATAAGEPINWASIISGNSYAEMDRMGNGTHGSAQALVTTFAASGGTVTATAANNFQPGQILTFVGNTSVLGLLMNGVTVQVVTASATAFTFASTATGTGTGEVGMAVSANSQVFPLQGANKALAATVTALSASGGIVTVTAANTYLPGAKVVITSAVSGIGTAISGQTLTVLASTGSAFTVTSSATGATGTGTASGINPPQPFSFYAWSENGSGYEYTYVRPTGSLFVQVGGSAISTPMANLAAGAYPAAVLNDTIRYEATFQKS